MIRPMPTQSPPASAPAPAVHRIEVAAKPGAPDPRADAVARDAAAIGLKPRSVRSARLYLVRAALDRAALDRVRDALLVNPVIEDSLVGAAPLAEGAALIEVHPLPGVMDPAAQTVRNAIRELTGLDDVEVTTGARYDFDGLTPEQARTLADRLLANPVVQAVHTAPYQPADFPHGHRYSLKLAHIPIRGLSDAALEKLSREAHLFLSLEEMKAIQAEYDRRGAEPTDIELETLAQTWSEHCVHKTLKSNIKLTGDLKDDVLEWRGRPGHTVHDDGSVSIDNLLKSTVAAATFELIAEGVDWTLSVFKDNAGVVAFDDDHAVCIKVETHNHPSALEPYGGAATGVGGCIRDVIGTGLGAKPIANTDVFCVAPPDTKNIPAGCLNPRRVLTQVVAGVRDYGNRMGIPTINGAVWFDERYIGNPLVYCGCVGVMPIDRIKGAARAGDLIVALGGRTGRDGIHGATFSSAELTDSHADEFAHAVQIGNAIEEKRLLDAILRARDEQREPLYSAITDCGAGGFSSAVGEMGAELGAEVHLERAPLKYDGLSYTEIWISEAQERMVLAVHPNNLKDLQRICDEESVELCVLGTFGTPNAELVLRYHNTEVGRLSMHFMHEGIPTPRREAHWTRPAPNAPKHKSAPVDADASRCLLDLLAHPNIASKRWIVRQYDHEVQGNTVLKPLVGPVGEGPGDASVIQPVPGSPRALAIGCGLATGVGDPLPGVGGDAYLMALAAIDEAVRNLVCSGADPERIAILDNFCWPTCKKPANLASLVRAAEGCYDGAKAYRTPFVSGKDSLNNQFTTEDGRTIEIPPTLLITGMGVVNDVARCVTSDLKRAGSVIGIVGRTTHELGGSHLQRLHPSISAPVPRTDLDLGPRLARAVASLIADGLVLSAHDVSDGGLLVAVAEMLIGAYDPTSDETLGAEIDLPSVPMAGAAHGDVVATAFSESPSRYLLEIPHANIEEVARRLIGMPCAVIGKTTDAARLKAPAASVDVSVKDLVKAWTAPLDW